MSNGIEKHPEKRGTAPWPKGKSANPNGRPSLKNDLARARDLGLMPELHRAMSEWREDAQKRLARIGPEKFLGELDQVIRDACEIDLPPTPEVARAMWWRTTAAVAFAGPNGTKDSVWTYANSDVGNRLLGKPREHVVIEDGASPPVDWSRVPAERREFLLEAIVELQGYLAEPSSTEH